MYFCPYKGVLCSSKTKILWTKIKSCYQKSQNLYPYLTVPHTNIAIEKSYEYWSEATADLNSSKAIYYLSFPDFYRRDCITTTENEGRSQSPHKLYIYQPIVICHMTLWIFLQNLFLKAVRKSCSSTAVMNDLKCVV